MNWLTFVLIAIIALFTWRAYRTGFVRELVSLCALILAVPVAGIFYDDMVPKVEPIVDDRALANLISFLSLLLGVLLGGQVVAHLLRDFVRMLNLGFIDQAAGAVFGLAKGLVLCQVILIALVLFPNPDLRDTIDGSGLATLLLRSAFFVLTILPSRFDDGIAAFLDGAQSVAGS